MSPVIGSVDASRLTHVWYADAQGGALEWYASAPTPHCSRGCLEQTARARRRSATLQPYKMQPLSAKRGCVSKVSLTVPIPASLRWPSEGTQERVRFWLPPVRVSRACTSTTTATRV